MLSALILSMLLEGSGQKPVRTLDRDRDSYWQCDKKTMGDNPHVHRAYLSTIVDDDGKIWFPSYNVIQKHTRFRYKLSTASLDDGFQLQTILIKPIDIPAVPTRPIWQFVYANQEVVQRDLQVSAELIRKNEAHKMIWGTRIKSEAINKLMDTEHWTLLLVDQDGSVVETRPLKDQSRAELRADQNSLISWAKKATKDPKGYCVRSTPELRHEMLESITN